jgi:hypothetical protein
MIDKTVTIDTCEATHSAEKEGRAGIVSPTIGLLGGIPTQDIHTCELGWQAWWGFAQYDKMTGS